MDIDQPDEEGQDRSTPVCPVCEELSTTFDPFMFLSLPLPSSNLREMTLTVLSTTDETTLPHQVTIRVPDKGTFKDLFEALGRGCSLRDDETLLIAEVSCNSIRQLFDDPNEPINLVLDSDRLVAYRLPKAMDGSHLVEFIHVRKDESFDSRTSPFGIFGIPLVARISDLSNGSKIREKFINLMKPFILPGEVIKDSVLDKNGIPDEEFTDNEFPSYLPDFVFYLKSNVCLFESLSIEMDEPVDVSPQTDQRIKVLVSWPDLMSERYNTSILSFLPEVGETKTDTSGTHDSISLDNCMDAFMKGEPLGLDDIWKIVMYDDQDRSTPVCPVCEELSTTFDPFLFLSLPLPSSNLREMTLTVLSTTDETTLPHQVTIRVPDKGTFKDLFEALGRGCSLRDDETLLIAEVSCNSIRQFFDEPNEPINLVLDSDRLVAYRLPKAMDGSHLVEFIHIRKDESFDSRTSPFGMFGIPLVARISDLSNGLKIREKFLNLMKPFILPGEVIKDSVPDKNGIPDEEFTDNEFPVYLPDFEFYLKSNVCLFESLSIEMDVPVDVSPQTDQCIKVLVSWPDLMRERYNTSILSILPEVGETKTDTSGTHDSISRHNCMDAFLKNLLKLLKRKRKMKRESVKETVEMDELTDDTS